MNFSIPRNPKFSSSNRKAKRSSKQRRQALTFLMTVWRRVYRIFVDHFQLLLQNVLQKLLVMLKDKEVKMLQKINTSFRRSSRSSPMWKNQKKKYEKILKKKHQNKLLRPRMKSRKRRTRARKGLGVEDLVQGGQGQGEDPRIEDPRRPPNPRAEDPGAGDPGAGDPGAGDPGLEAQGVEEGIDLDPEVAADRILFDHGKHFCKFFLLEQDRPCTTKICDLPPANPHLYPGGCRTHW